MTVLQSLLSLYVPAIIKKNLNAMWSDTNSLREIGLEVNVDKDT
jgi:hypothetical protein